MGGSAVVALVDGVDGRYLPERRTTEGVPVAVGAEKAVKNEEGRSFPTVLVVKEIHTNLLGNEGLQLLPTNSFSRTNTTPVTWRPLVVSTAILLVSPVFIFVAARQPAPSDSVVPSAPPTATDSTATAPAEHAPSQPATLIGVWGAASVRPGEVLGKIPQNQLDLLGLRFQRRLLPRGTAPRPQPDGPTLTYTADLVPFAAISIPQGTDPGGAPAIQSVEETGLNTWGFGIYPIGLRVSFRPSTTVRPFVAGHTGFFYFSEPIPDVRGRQTNFAAGIGGGVHIPLPRRTTLTLGYRYHHLSNGFRGSINPGLDANLLYLGLTLAP
ncbi:MAG: hypothetical protein BRD30_04825 [Bacteroidetes bacterium QH_2_63_10]|nr:MAG: hypothetical protein BRD30_04825 [Bacteroidetes bacterium QH_2_63_10]